MNDSAAPLTDYLSSQARTVRVLLWGFSLACILIAAVITAFPSVVAALLSLVHTGEPEWTEMNRHLLDRLPVALILAAVAARIVHFVYSYLPKVLRWWMSLPQERFLAIVMTSAMLLRIAWMLLFRTRPWADGIWYDELARNLAAGKGYAWNDGTATAFLPIGYPALLSLFYYLLGSGVNVAKMLNLSLSVVSIPVTYAVFRRVWNERVARIGTLLFAVSITHIAFVGLVFSEMLFTFLLMAAIWLIVRPSLEERVTRFDVLAGLVVGAAALVRPIALLIPLALLLALAVKGRRLSLMLGRAAVIGVCASAMLVPNIIRNYALFGEFIPLSTNGGINFLIGNNPHATGYYLMPDDVRLTGSEAQQSREAYAIGEDWLFTHPLDAGVLAFKKLFHLYHRDDSGILFSCVKTAGDPPWTTAATAVVLGNGMYYIILILALLYVVRRRKGLSLNEYFLIFLWCSVTAFYLIYFGSHRFHIPLIPLFIGFASAWIGEGLEEQ